MKLVIETTNQKYFRICVHIQCFLGWKQPGANYMSTSVKSLLLLCYKSFLKKKNLLHHYLQCWYCKFCPMLKILCVQCFVLRFEV